MPWEGEEMSNTNILLEAGTNELEIVEFYIDGVRADGSKYRGNYGINAAKVLEIIRRPDIIDFPEKKHPCILGAFRLRQRIIPLIDISIWFKKRMNRQAEDKVIVTEFNNIINAFMITGIQRIHRLSWSEIIPPDLSILKLTNDNITGIVKIEDRIIFVLDMEKIISELSPELALHDNGVVEKHAANMEIRILFVDDSSMVRKTLEKGLIKAGFKVVVHNDGRQALDYLQNVKLHAQREGKPIQEYVNLVISDVEMPVMDGHTLTKAIKDDPVLKELPVMLFSSLISEALRHKGEQVGADDQIAKPDVVSLTERVRMLLTARQGIVF